mmetsp:Transcript_1035/g.2679  ORF Transcript_1035/g.2679 Transcript_1035/m.2679 type:complete len:226 (+) Transcript_1035:882-1559(+)
MRWRAEGTHNTGRHCADIWRAVRRACGCLSFAGTCRLTRKVERMRKRGRRGTPDAISHGAVDPHVLAVEHGGRLGNLHQVAGLPTRAHACVKLVVRHVPSPLWHRRFEDVSVELHNLMQQEVAPLIHPVDHVRLACSHGAGRVDEPWARLPVARRDDRVDQPILQHLSLVSVDAVVGDVKLVADAGVLAHVARVRRGVPVDLGGARFVVVVRRDNKAARLSLGGV